jgi:hypothetical protein
MKQLSTREMKFVSCIAGYGFLGDRSNGDILEELDMDTIENKLAGYKYD